MNMEMPMSIGNYLLYALKKEGVDHIFGIPGDYILSFYDLLTHSEIQHVGTTREDTAAFAADGYARNRGLGALAVTYGVGALNTINAIAGAYAESSPVVVISGAPGVKEQSDDPLLHHRFGPFTYQREIFERISAYTAVLDDPVLAFRQITQALETARQQCRPVYLELPRDRVLTSGMSLPSPQHNEPELDPATLDEAIHETLLRMHRARHPVIVAGIELHRRGLQSQLRQLVDQTGLPVAATLTGKSVMAENHASYLGIYEGAMSSELARLTVEKADFILMLGLTLNDVDTGIYSARLDPNCMVRASKGEVIISHHRFQNIGLVDFMSALTGRVLPGTHETLLPDPKSDTPGKVEAGDNISIRGLIDSINRSLTPGLSVVCDTGDCLFASIELRVPEHSQFFASAFYTSMGFAVPAALGVQLANPHQRALILVGDGAFQMTGTELSTHARFALAPIVIVFNNHGYSTERYILEGPFNDISEWRFDKLGEVFGSIRGYDIHTQKEFDQALVAALENTNQINLLNVHLQVDDPSPAMRRLGRHLGKVVKSEKEAVD